jgi:hypothetical protein
MVNLPHERDLPAGRTSARREHLMTEIVDRPLALAASRGRARRRRTLVGVVTCLGVFAAAPVTAYELGYIGHGKGAAEINMDSLDVVYQGQRYTRQQMTSFQRDGKGLVVVSDAESARSGVVHAFDTEAEATAWHEAQRK